MEERANHAPPPSSIGFLLGAVMLELEASNPGLARRVVARLEDDATQADVIRLRGPRAGAETRRALDEAVRWAEAISLIASTVVPTPPQATVRTKRCRWTLIGR